MIDFKNKKIYFGDGDVIIRSIYGSGKIEFFLSDHPIKIGVIITEEERIPKERIVIKEAKPYDLLNIFLTVNSDNKIVSYNNITFDFTNYNKDSVKACIIAGNRTVDPYMLAC